jgi:hypothetical protein
MQTKATPQLGGSPVPGLNPESPPAFRRRGPLARLGAALRGDKYMANAYPPEFGSAHAAAAAGPPAEQR